MLYFDGEIIATCGVCDTENKIYVSQLDVNCKDDDYHENGMGVERLYEISQTYDCEHCGCEFEVCFNITEYPEGIFSDFSDISTGVSCYGMPSIKHANESLIYTFPKKEIYIPEQRIITDLSEINNTIPKLIIRIQEDNSFIYKISSREFEEIIAEIFRENGFDVDLTKKTRDGGKDIIAIHKSSMGIDTCYLIECKKYAPNNKVGVGIVRTLYGVHSSLDGANKSIIATTSSFTSGAKQFANDCLRSKWHMDLKDHNDVLKWINAYRYTNHLNP